VPRIHHVNVVVPFGTRVPDASVATGSPFGSSTRTSTVEGSSTVTRMRARSRRPSPFGLNAAGRAATPTVGAVWSTVTGSSAEAPGAPALFSVARSVTGPSGT